MSLIMPNGQGQFGREITEDYNEVNLLEADSAKQAKMEMWIAKNIGETLVAHYPNRQWGVSVDIPGQMLVIKCNSVSMEKGYVIYMANRTIHELQERAKLAAGEILERYGLSRSRGFDADILETLERDLRDDVIIDSGDADAESI